MAPKFRCWFKDTGTQAAHMVEWNELREFKALGDLLQYSGENKLFHLMQSTGLKDKNGVEIFEGDLVKVSVDNGFDYLFEELSIVKPSKFHSGLVCSLKSHEAEYRIIHAEILGYEYEVVGNIYENPELLEQANEN